MEPNNVDREDIVAEVQAAFLQYETDLVNNDVDRLIEWFWADRRAVRFGIDENLYGFDAISSYRREQVQATPPRALGHTTITTFGADVATVNTEFHPVGSEVIGRQSQTWCRTPDGWRIASAHVSWLSGRAPGIA